MDYPSRQLNFGTSIDNGPGPHDHTSFVDEGGNGRTSFSQGGSGYGHSHPIVNWLVQAAEGHTHTITGIEAGAIRTSKKDTSHTSLHNPVIPKSGGFTG